MTVRLLAIAIVLALVGGGIASAWSAAAVATEVAPGDGLDVTAPDALEAPVIRAPRSARVEPPPVATLTPRQHVDPLFRPPRAA